MMICKNTCEQYRAKSPDGFRAISYKDGAKWCPCCTLFINWEGKKCPCCGHILRIIPRYSKYRKKVEVYRY